MTDLHVTHWRAARPDDDSIFDPLNLGGLGGFFNMTSAGQRWKDYLARYYPEWHPHLEALRAEILRRRLWKGGEWHQDEDGEGVPVLSDGHYFAASMRGWGDLMAAVWSEEHDRDYCYVHFAWDDPEGGPDDAENSQDMR